MKAFLRIFEYQAREMKRKRKLYSIHYPEAQSLWVNWKKINIDWYDYYMRNCVGRTCDLPRRVILTRMEIRFFTI